MSDQSTLIELFNCGKYSELEAKARASVNKSPRFAFGWKALAAAQKKLGKNPLDAAKKAAALLPNDHEAQNTFGIALKGAGNYGDAIAAYRKAVAIKPSYVEAYNNLGHALYMVGKIDRAVDAYKQAIKIAPNFLDARNNLLFTRNNQPGVSPQQIFEEAREYGRHIPGPSSEFVHSKIDPAKRLRIGFVSGDFRIHSVGYFLDSFLQALRVADQVDMFAYYNHAITDDLTQRLKQSFHVWREVAGMSDAEASKLIYSDQIDILIDLSGHTAHNRLPVFAMRPAPIQLSWLGYMGTTGVPAMDHVIGDPYCAPQFLDGTFTERLARLPSTCICFSPPEIDIEPSSLPALANGYITFGSLNNPSKINDEVIAAWAKILIDVPNSRLLCKYKNFGNGDVRADFARRFAEHGIDHTRLEMHGHSSRLDHFKFFHRIDIALDPFPYVGVTTTVETIWMGVPVVSLAGDRMLSRLGVSILSNAGLSDWLADSMTDYVSKATNMANNHNALANIRAELRAKALESPLFDAKKFAVEFAIMLRSIMIKSTDKDSETV